MKSTIFGTFAWIERVGRPRARPALSGDVTCDVAIIGGGLAGAMSAYVFAQAGVKTILVEAGRVAEGATAGTPGLSDVGAAARFADLRQRHGLRAARHMWDAVRRAGLDAQALVRRLAIRCDLERVDVTDIAVEGPQGAALEAEHRALTEAGFEAALLTGSRVRATTGLAAAAALRRGDAAHADPLRLARGLVRHAEQQGAKVFEGTTVRRIVQQRKGIELVVHGGVVRAAAVVVATNVPQPDLKALHRHLRQEDATVIVIESVPAPMRRGLEPARGALRDTGEPPHAWRLDRQDRLRVWQTGQDAAGTRRSEQVVRQRAGQLMYEFSLLYPDLSGIRPTHAWTVSSWRSVDGLVIAGPHRAFPRHLFAAGLGFDGLAGSYLAARLNLRAFRGSPDRGDELFGFIR